MPQRWTSSSTWPSAGRGSGRSTSSSFVSWQATARMRVTVPDDDGEAAGRRSGAELLVEPVERPLEEERAAHALAVALGPLGGREADEVLGTLEVVEQQLPLAGRDQVGLVVADERRASDELCA